MSRENLESLLDAMLEESAAAMEAAAAREREEREPKVRRAPAQNEAPAPKIDDVAQLASLADGDLRKVIAKSPPDDLLVVLATSGDALQRRVLANLSPESVKWMRDNLAHIDRVTNAERESAHAKVRKAANALLAAGEIALPAPEEAAGAAEAGDLRALLVDLVRLAARSGPEAVHEALGSVGEPLLEEGLALVARGTAGGELARALAARKADLLAEHAARLGWIEEAVLAIAEGEPAERFAERLFGS